MVFHVNSDQDKVFADLIQHHKTKSNYSGRYQDANWWDIDEENRQIAMANFENRIIPEDKIKAEPDLVSNETINPATS